MSAIEYRIRSRIGKSFYLNKRETFMLLSYHRTIDGETSIKTSKGETLEFENDQQLLNWLNQLSDKPIIRDSKKPRYSWTPEKRKPEQTIKIPAGLILADEVLLALQLAMDDVKSGYQVTITGITWSTQPINK